MSTASSGGRSDAGANVDDFDIVSLQSSANPGCILALDHIADARNVNMREEEISIGKTVSNQCLFGICVEFFFIVHQFPSPAGFQARPDSKSGGFQA